MNSPTLRFSEKRIVAIAGGMEEEMCWMSERPRLLGQSTFLKSSVWNGGEGGSTQINDETDHERETPRLILNGCCSMALNKSINSSDDALRSAAA
jgi:hypothetical protein